MLEFAELSCYGKDFPSGVEKVDYRSNDTSTVKKVYHNLCRPPGPGIMWPTINPLRAQSKLNIFNFYKSVALCSFPVPSIFCGYQNVPKVMFLNKLS